MGTYYTHGSTRASLVAEILAPQAPRPNAEGKIVMRNLLAHCLRGNILWTVNEVLLDGGFYDHWIGCDLLVRSSDGWGYKPLDEDMHPYYYTCPLSYLEKTKQHIPSQDSTNWRSLVRDAHRDNKEKRHLRNTCVRNACKKSRG